MTTRFADEPRPTGEIPLDEIRRADRMGNPEHPRSADRWRWVRWFWLIAGLVCLLVVWVLLILRWRDVSHPLAIAIVGIMPLLAIGPFVVGLLGAWWSRSLTLRVLAALTALPFLYTTSPVNAVIGCRADEAATSDAENVFTIYTANVWFESPGGQPDEIGAAIAAEDPDILFLQEVQWDFLSELRLDTRLDGFVYRTTDMQGLPIQDMVWSRWPIQEASFTGLANARLVEATVESPTGPIIVSPIHLQAPITRNDANFWKAQHRLLAEIDRSSPRILAGDFNATRDHQPFRHLLNAGWTDVHEKKGCGLDATWPVGGRIPTPLMRLDHVLVTEHFDVLDVRLGTPGGSDHLPVISTLRLRDQT